MRAMCGWVVLGCLVGTVAQAATPPRPPSKAGLGGRVIPRGGYHGDDGRDHEDDPYEPCGDSDVADLDIRAWSLVPELPAKANAMSVFRVRNEGPCPARNLRVSASGYDQFSLYDFTCPDLASDDGSGRCVFPTLAPGETRTFVLTATVCAFVTGEGRDAATYAIFEADSTDPDGASEVLPTYEIAYAWVHITGPYDDTGCP